MKQLSILYLLFLSLMLISKVNAQLPSIAVVHAEAKDSYNADLVTQLSPYFSVTLINAKNATPTYENISTFPAIFTYSDGVYADPTTLGAILKRYVDNGGGLVVAMYTLNLGNKLTGGFFPNYYALYPGGQLLYGKSNIMINNANHPVMNGVDYTFNCGDYCYRSGEGTVNPGFEAVASYAEIGNTPMVVVGSINGTNRVDINFFPISTNAFTSYGFPPNGMCTQIIINSLNWVLPGSRINTNTASSHSIQSIDRTSTNSVSSDRSSTNSASSLGIRCLCGLLLLQVLFL